MTDKIYETNEHGVVINYDTEVLEFPKAYKFTMEFKKAETPDGIAMGYYWSTPTSGSGSPCSTPLDGETVNEYKVKAINHLIKCLQVKCGVDPGWYANTAPKIINKLEKYKEEL